MKGESHYFKILELQRGGANHDVEHIQKTELIKYIKKYGNEDRWFKVCEEMTELSKIYDLEFSEWTPDIINNLIGSEETNKGKYYNEITDALKFYEDEKLKTNN